MRLVVKAELVVPRYSGGIEHFTSGLLRGLDRQMVPADDLAAVVARGTAREWRDAVGQATKLRFIEVAATASLTRLRQRSSNFSGLRKSIDWLAYSAATRPWIERFRRGVERRALTRLEPDVVYYPYRPKHGCGDKAVLTVHHLPQEQAGPNAVAESRMLATNIARAAAVVTSWPHPYRDLRRTFPELADRLFLIPLPILNSPLGPPIPANGVPFVLYPAAVTPHKNHRPLVEAIAQLRRSRDVRLVCTGTRISPLIEDLTALAERLGIGDSVEFRGFVSREGLDELYRAASAVAVPSLWEAASGPVFEAFSYGKPVACSDVPPIRDQVEWAGGTVAFFDPLDAPSIAAAIADVIDHPQAYREGGVRAAQFMDQFTWERTAADYLQVFRWVSEGADQHQRPNLSSAPSGWLTLR